MDEITRENALNKSPEEFVKYARKVLLNKGLIPGKDYRLESGCGANAFGYVAKTLNLNSAFYHKNADHTNLILDMNDVYTRLYDPILTKTRQDIVVLNTTDVEPLYIEFSSNLEYEFRRWVNDNRNISTGPQAYENRRRFLIEKNYSLDDSFIDSVGAPQDDSINCTLYCLQAAVRAEENTKPVNVEIAIDGETSADVDILD